MALVILGLVGGLRLRWRSSRARGVLRELPLLAGLCACVAGSLLVCASISDGLRYQSLLMAPLVVVGARAQGLWRDGRRLRHFASFVLFGGLSAAALFALVSGMPGRHWHDSQGQEWVALKRAMSEHKGSILFIHPDRGQRETAVVEVPRGRWSAEGPTSDGMGLKTALARCAKRQPLPESIYVMRSIQCVGRGDRQAQASKRPRVPDDVTNDNNTCAGLAPLRRGDALAALRIQPARSLSYRGVPGEFLRYPPSPFTWRLYRAGCPGPGTPGTDQKP